MAHRALHSKADDVVVLDLRKLSFTFDFFVLCTASSDRRIRTIAEDIEEILSAKGVRRGHIEGQREIQRQKVHAYGGGSRPPLQPMERNGEAWVLLDYGPVVAHLFSPETRHFYDLERLWADAPRLSLKPGSPVPLPKRHWAHHS